MSRKARVIFTDKKISDRGIMSVVLGGICVLSQLYSFFVSYLHEGEVPARFGAALFLTLLFAVVGLSLGISAFKDIDKKRLLPFLGIVLNGVTVIILAFLLWIGLQ